MPRRVLRHAVEQPQDQSIRLIPLTQGQNAIVDADDFDELSLYSWYAGWCKFTKTFYAMRHGENHRTIRMHQKIILAECVDHVNGNTLDNRRFNLRVATASQNSMNRRIQSNNKSGVSGVSWDRESGKWAAYIKMNGKQIRIGRFPSIEDASKARSIRAKEAYGDFYRD